MRTPGRQIILVGLVAIGVSLAGCLGGTHVGDKYQSGGEESSKIKIQSEAYLFDVKYFHQGKKNSFRLEIYHTDSLAGLAGRGYLGKGALKGWLSHDSLAIYFPTVNEHLYEPISALLSKYECAEGITKVDLLSIFSALPQAELLSESILIEIDESNSKRPIYLLNDKLCPWSLSLTYDKRSIGWRLRHFEFDDGRGTRLEGNRRKLREKAKVPQSRYRLDIPAGSVGITL